MARICWLVAVLALAACDFNITSPSPGSQSSTTTTTVNVTQPPGGTGTGTPPGTPTPGAPAPFPPGAQAIVAGIAAANPTLLAQSCQATYGAAAWAYLDLVVDTLRATDPRWGYACRPSNCGAPIEDGIAYYGGTGTPTTGSLGIYIVDIIGGWCGTPPVAGWIQYPYTASQAWTSRGRF